MWDNSMKRQHVENWYGAMTILGGRQHVDRTSFA